MYSSAGASKQYAQAPLDRFAIPLRANRANGETFPAIEGVFFYVEASDLPVRIAFNGRDESQAVGISSGFQLNAPFSGITLFHEDYTGGTGVSAASLILYTSRNPRAFNQYVAPAVQLALPWLDNGLLGATWRAIFPIFPRARFLSIDAVIVVNKATDPGPVTSYVFFTNDSGALQPSPVPIVYKGNNFNQAPTVSPELNLSTPITAAVNYIYQVKKRLIPIPSFVTSATMNFFFNIGAPTSMGTIVINGSII